MRTDALLWAEIKRARAKWGPRPLSVVPEPVGPGEESVWDYPRPPRVEPSSARITVEFAGKIIVETRRAIRVVETAGAPVYYIPPEDIEMRCLEPVPDYRTLCEWKGFAVYYDLVDDGRRSEKAAFAYPDPFTDLGAGYDAIAGFIGFFPDRVGAAFLNDERVRPQPGGFYSGWVTDAVKGPMKGVPGSGSW